MDAVVLVVLVLLIANKNHGEKESSADFSGDPRCRRGRVGVVAL